MSPETWELVQTLTSLVFAVPVIFFIILLTSFFLRWIIAKASK